MPKSTSAYLSRGFSAFYFSAVAEPEDQDSVVPDGDSVNCCQLKAVVKLRNRLVPLCEISEKPFNCSPLCFLGFAFSGKLIIAPFGFFISYVNLTATALRFTDERFCLQKLYAAFMNLAGNTAQEFKANIQDFIFRIESLL